MLRKRTTPIDGPRFAFAGFTWPRYLARLERGTLARRLEKRRNGCTGEYYHSPKPGNRGGIGFYLGSDSPFTLRYELSGRSFCAGLEYGDDSITGIVFRLPRGRGFLAGWTMGENMASTVDYAPIFDSADGAMRCADSMAESAAESERDYQESERARIDAEESELCQAEED